MGYSTTPVLGRDNYDREILDVTAVANRPGCLRAERQGRHALVLSKLDRPIRCLDGRQRRYRVEEVGVPA